MDALRRSAFTSFPCALQATHHCNVVSSRDNRRSSHDSSSSGSDSSSNIINLPVFWLHAQQQVTVSGTFSAFAQSAATAASSGANVPSVPFLQKLSVSTDGTVLCAASSEKALHFFDTQHLQHRSTFVHAHGSQITDISFFHLHPQLLASASQDGSVRFWDLRTPVAAATPATTTRGEAAAVHVQLAPLGSTEAAIWSFSINSSDCFLAVSCKNSFSLFDIRSLGGTSSKNYNGSTWTTCDVNSSSNGYCNSEVHNGSCKSGKKWGAGSTAKESNSSQCSSRISNGLVKPNREKLNRQHLRQQTDVQKVLKRVEAHADTINSLKFHPSIDWMLLSGGEDGLVCVYDLRSLTQQPLCTTAPTTTVTEAIFSRDSIRAAPTAAAARAVSEFGEVDIVEQLLSCCFSNEKAVRSFSVVGPQEDCLCVCSTTDDVALWQLKNIRSGRHDSNFHVYNDVISMSSSTRGILAHAEMEDCCRRAVPLRSNKGSDPSNCESASSTIFQNDSINGSNSSCQDHTNCQSNFSNSSISNSSCWIEKLAEWQNLRLHPQLTSGESAAYVIENFYETATGRLFLLSGSVAGDLLLFHANLQEAVPTARFAGASHSGNQGHTGVIRAACALSSGNGVCGGSSSRAGRLYVSAANDDAGGSNDCCVLLTCGEDGRICAWKQQPQEAEEPWPRREGLSSAAACAELSSHNICSRNALLHSMDQSSHKTKMKNICRPAGFVRASPY